MLGRDRDHNCASATITEYMTFQETSVTYVLSSQGTFMAHG